jgi:Homeodomain-like domain
MVQVTGHLGVSELQCGYRGSTDVKLARHYHVIWLLAQGHTARETARLTGFVPRWIEELLVRYNRFGPASLGHRRRRTIQTGVVLALLRERLKSRPMTAGSGPRRRSRR